MNLPSDVRAGRATAFDAALGLGLLVLLKATAAFVMPIAAALLLVLLASSSTEALQRRGLPAALAAAVATFVPAGLVGVGVVLSAPAAAGWWRDILAAFARLAGSLQASGGDGMTGTALRWLVGHDWTGGVGGSLAHAAGPWALEAVSVLMLTFFLLWAQRSLLAALLQVAPGRRARVRLLGALRDARRGAGGYLATMGWINLGLALLTGVGLLALGVAHVPAWIAVTFVLLFVPYLGPAAIALLLATAGHGAGAMAMAAPPLLFLLLHAIEAQFVSPWLMGRRLGVGRPALLLAVMAGGWVWGVAGGVLAVPLLIAARALLARQRGASLWKALLAGEAERPPSLRASAARVLENAPGGEPPRQVHRMPPPLERPVECASSTSPKPILPRSTASP